MPSIKDIKEPETRFFGIFAGDSGSGKSAAAASFPAPCDRDFDGRILGILNAAKSCNIEDCFFENCYGWNFDKINDLGDQILISLLGTRHPYKTEILDSVTAIARNLVNSAISGPGGHELHGKLVLTGPKDYKIESQGLNQIFDKFRSIFYRGINVIFTCHVQNKWARNPEDEFGERVIVGKRLSLREGVAETILPFVNEVYYFEHSLKGQNMKFYVTFQSDLARSCAYGLTGTHDITNKNFYQFWTELIRNKRDKEKK